MFHTASREQATQALRDDAGGEWARGALSLRELRDALDRMIEKNRERGREERNELPVVVRYRTGKTHRSDRRRAITKGRTAMMCLAEGPAVIELDAGERLDRMELAGKEGE